MSQENEGFFKKFHETVNSGIDDVTRNNFANLETNSKRVSYLSGLPVIKNYDLTSDVEKCQLGGEFPVKKDLEKAKQLKDEGNKAVQKGDWAKALQLYSQGMVYMPHKESKFYNDVLVMVGITCHNSRITLLTEICTQINVLSWSRHRYIFVHDTASRYKLQIS